MPENVRFGLPPEIVEAIASAPAPSARSKRNKYGNSSPAPSHRRVPQLRFGKIDDLASRVARRVDGARAILVFRSSTRKVTGAANSRPTPLSSRITFSCTRCWEPAIQERFQKCCQLDPAASERRWWVEHLPRRPSNISASVKAYFALKLAGYDPDHPALVRARKKILELGGVTEVNTFTKIYLCFLGQYDYDAVPAIPPEIVLFPNWFWFNIYEISSWSRAMLVPLSICYAKKPFKKIPEEMGIEEFFVGGRDKSRMHLHWSKKLFSWRNFFLSLDRLTHWSEAVHIRPLRSHRSEESREMDAGAL